MTLLFDQLTSAGVIPTLSIGVTSTRNGMTEAQRVAVSQIVERSQAQVAHHGDCIGGDSNFHDICRRMGLWIVGHPPTNPKYRAWCDVDDLRSEKDYLVRDEDIVRESTWMIAAPKNNKWIPHSGTWATVTITRRLEKPLALVFPGGTVQYERWLA